MKTIFVDSVSERGMRRNQERRETEIRKTIPSEKKKSLLRREDFMICFRPGTPEE